MHLPLCFLIFSAQPTQAIDRLHNDQLSLTSPILFFSGLFGASTCSHTPLTHPSGRPGAGQAQPQPAAAAPRPAPQRSAAQRRPAAAPPRSLLPAAGPPAELRSPARRQPRHGPGPLPAAAAAGRGAAGAGRRERGGWHGGAARLQRQARRGET